MDINWEAELAGLLNDLSTAQRELLELLGEKRKLLAAADTPGMAALQPREQAMLARLQACQEKRAALLSTAQAQGLPSDSICQLATTLPRPSADSLSREIKEVAARSRLLQHQEAVGDGIDDLAIFRDGVWYLDSNGNGKIDTQDQVIKLGQAGDVPVAGDWDGDGRQEPGVYRDGKLNQNTARK
jgi:hypothetical protein